MATETTKLIPYKLNAREQSRAFTSLFFSFPRQLDRAHSVHSNKIWELTELLRATTMSETYDGRVRIEQLAMATVAKSREALAGFKRAFESFDEIYRGFDALREDALEELTKLNAEVVRVCMATRVWRREFPKTILVEFEQISREAYTTAPPPSPNTAPPPPPSYEDFLNEMEEFERNERAAENAVENDENKKTDEKEESEKSAENEENVKCLLRPSL